ncbi:MAG: endonuclease, partial [Proteobacteria bacterium]|nr:endonuclease [Pseudomonadota bacterium]
DKLIENSSWSGKWNVTKEMQINALGKVFQALDADGIMIIEAPDNSSNHSAIAALEGFAAHFGLRQNKAIIGFTSGTQQEVAFLYDPAAMDVIHDPQGIAEPGVGVKDNPRFDGTFHLDVDVDSKPEKITFSKPPLELLVIPQNGNPTRLIGVHAKSKAPHGARNEQQEVRISIENRRKQLAQCIWLRMRVEQHLDAGDDLIVLGDLNDGPGLDEYEKLFGHSGVEIVMGAAKADDKTLREPHAEAAMSARSGTAPTTSRFYNHRNKTYLNALLDFIMVSPDLAKTTTPVWKIWHPFNDQSCFDNKDLCDALLIASDHFPVTIDLNIKTQG